MNRTAKGYLIAALILLVLLSFKSFFFDEKAPQNELQLQRAQEVASELKDGLIKSRIVGFPEDGRVVIRDYLFWIIPIGDRRIGNTDGR